MQFDQSADPPGAPTREYRLYFLHPTDGHFVRSFDFQAAHDEEALRMADAWREGRRMELWNGTRKIRSWQGF
jgi:hypothetical protein